jgi:hypothetical protein
MVPQLARPYGGLSWGEMEKLVRRCQAGPIDLGAFLLAQAYCCFMCSRAAAMA